MTFSKICDIRVCAHVYFIGRLSCILTYFKNLAIIRIQKARKTKMNITILKARRNKLANKNAHENAKIIAKLDRKIRKMEEN